MAFTFEEIIVLTNEEILSNVSNLAGLIRTFEGIEWRKAQAKAGQLFKEQKALEYIVSVRERVKTGEQPTPQVKTSKTCALIQSKFGGFQTEFQPIGRDRTRSGRSSIE